MKLMIVTEQPVLDIKHENPVMPEILECEGVDNCFGRIMNNICPQSFKKDYYGQSGEHKDKAILPRLSNTIDYLVSISKNEIEVYWTHYIKCQGNIRKGLTKEDKKKASLDSCADKWIKKEILEFKPDIILSLGTYPSNYMIKGKGYYLYKDVMLDNHNDSSEFNLDVFILQHPAKGNRYANPYYDGDMPSDKLKDVLKRLLK